MSIFFKQALYNNLIISNCKQEDHTYYLKFEKGDFGIIKQSPGTSLSMGDF